MIDQYTFTIGQLKWILAILIIGHFYYMTSFLYALYAALYITLHDYEKSLFLGRDIPAIVASPVPYL